MITEKGKIILLPANFLSASKLISFLFILACCFENCTQPIKAGAAEKKSELKYYTVADFKTVEKYDVHVHVNTYKNTFLKQAGEDNFRLVTINWDDVNDPPPMEEQQKFALYQT